MKKNKMKSRNSITKRFKVTSTGKILRRRAFRSHLRSKKSRNKKLNQNRPVVMTGYFAKKLKKFLGV